MNGAPDSVLDEFDFSALPDFFLKLPGNGPTGRGRLLDRPVDGRAGRFVVFAGSPARAEEVPSLKVHLVSSSRLRARLKADGAYKQSERWPGWLELTRDVECSSPSQAAEILQGSSANGLRSWKTHDGRLLGELIGRRALGVASAWLVRGSSVRGVDLVQRLWLPEGVVSLPASRLRQLITTPGADHSAPTLSLDQMRRIVDEDYADAETYSVREQLAEDLHAFVTLMKPDDQIVTLSGGELRIGSIVGEGPEQVESSDGLSNLRRAVEWSSESFDYIDLPDELQQMLSVQRDVVNLAKVAALIRGLGVSDQEIDEQKQDDPTLESVEIARRELRLPDPDAALADELLIPRDWLQEVRDLLWDDKQVVLYGPPGTGKTYLAQHLAEYLSGRDPQRVKLVQFHPSYSYEDFFEGFRPREDPKTGNVAFRITAGPLRELAELAAREGNRHIPHFLIIDELNRANLAKVFGELYFLLEYRKRTVRLTYSGDDFGLPPNLFIIGTMNTADRSIALVDAAMRRRFAFIELSPAEEPTKGLLHRWLARDGRDAEPALLLDALNACIDDPDFKIGPSYLMKPGVYRDGGLERTWRTKILPLLEEHHYGEGIEVNRRYGLAALRRAISASTAPAPADSAASFSPLEQDASGLLTASADDDPEASR
jgi:5-methylcytosine-specific restriction protein B